MSSRLCIVQLAYRGQPLPRPALWHVVTSPRAANRLLRELRRDHPDNVFEVRK